MSHPNITTNLTSLVILDNSTMTEAEQNMDWIRNVRFSIEGVTQGIVGTVGLLGNIISILVLCRKEMDLKPTFRQILITLVTFDILCIIFNLLLFCLPHLSDKYLESVFPYIVPTVLPFAQIALTGSIYSTLAVAIERFISVCHPHTDPAKNCGTFSILGLIIFSVAFNVCRFLEFETTYETRVHEFHLGNENHTQRINITMAKASTTDLRRDPLYSQITMITMLLVSGIVPLCVLIVLNTKIYMAIRIRNQRLLNMSSKQRRDFDVAAVLVGIILVFIVCHSFKFFVNCYEAYIMHFGMDMKYAWSEWMDAVVSFSHLLATVNSSLNFVIYCYKDRKFRETLIKLSQNSACTKSSMTAI